MPFVIGIYEFQLPHLDRELVDLVEEYFPHFMGTLGGKKPALGRVVPVNASIEARAEILAYEDMRGLIQESHSFLLNECICRKERALQGHPCRHPLETCMVFSPEEDAFDYFRYSGRVISKDEALRVLDAVEKEGLVHATYNVRERPMFVCNCCSCCCGFMRGLKEFQAPYVITRSNFVAAIDQETCNACDVCASERCPMQAISSQDGSYSVSQVRCIGCGVCAVACPTDSIRLVRRPPAQQAIPPKNLVYWSVERSAARSGPLTRLALRMWLARHG
jgi:Pyruvate/2-oxoacid:ferredoxin oxidoreductase delta subunit